jgi:hypothetical protein
MIPRTLIDTWSLWLKHAKTLDHLDPADSGSHPSTRGFKLSISISLSIYMCVCADVDK